MNIQSNLQHLNMKLNFPPAVTSLSHSLNDAQKTLLANKIVQGQTRIFQPSQPYIFPGHQQMMQARISFLNTYLRNLRNSTFASEHPQSLNSQGHKDEKMTCEKLEFVEKEPEFPVKKESSENHSIQSFSTTTINKIKQETSNKFIKKDKKSSTQNANDARRRKNYWLPHEDNMLLDLMKTHGQKWTKIAACLEGRTGKQVRDRYLNYLKPSIKQRRWTPEEDELLDKLYKEFGNKWSSIAASLGDRTENQVKNRFYSGVRKGKYVQGKGVVSGNETDQSLKLVKMDPDFETNMTPNLRSEVSSNTDNTHSKDEAFEMCDTLSQSTQSQTKSRSQTQLKEERKNSAESKGVTSCFKEFLMEQEFAKYQNKFLENLINTKSFNSERLLLQPSEESREDPYKKIKCENLDNEQSINVKQEVL